MTPHAECKHYYINVLGILKKKLSILAYFFKVYATEVGFEDAFFLPLVTFLVANISIFIVLRTLSASSSDLGFSLQGTGDVQGSVFQSLTSLVICCPLFCWQPTPWWKSSLSHLAFREGFSFEVCGFPLNFNDFADLFSSEVIRSPFADGKIFIFKLCFKHFGREMMPCRYCCLFLPHKSAHHCLLLLIMLARYHMFRMVCSC